MHLSREGCPTVCWPRLCAFCFLQYVGRRNEEKDFVVHACRLHVMEMHHQQSRNCTAQEIEHVVRVSGITRESVSVSEQGIRSKRRSIDYKVEQMGDPPAMPEEWRSEAWRGRVEGQDAGACLEWCCACREEAADLE
jgi:hypothetical protein